MNGIRVIPMKPLQSSRARQRGAVLIVGLVMLTVMTMLVVSMLKTSIIDLKIGGVSQDALVNFSNAEIALASYLNNNTGNLSNNCLTIPVGVACNNFTLPGAFLNGSTPTLAATQTYCGDKPGFTGNQIGVSIQSVVIDVVSTATSVLGNQTRLHLGLSQDIPPGACSI